MAFSFLFNAFLLEYMQSAKCPKPPIQLRKTLRGESEFHESEISAKKRCFRGPVTDCNNYNNLVSTNDGTYTPFNGHDKRINTDSSTNDQNFRVAQPQSALRMRPESKQNSVQNHTKTQVDNPWITVVCQAICGEYEDSMLNDNSWAHGNNPSLNSSNMMTEQSHNIPHQLSFSTVNHVPSGQYISDYTTQMSHEESGVSASLHKPNAQISFDILYDTSTGSQNNVEQEDLDTMGAFQLNQLDTGTSCNHHSFTSGKLNISYDASDRHWDNSQNLNALSEFEAMVNTASQQLEPKNILTDLETYCFLSFGVNKSTDTSFYHCLNDIKLYCSQKAASDDAKTSTATKPNLTGLFCTFSHGVDSDNIATSAFIAIITNKTLFGDTTATIEQREYQYINYGKWVKDPKHGDSVYTYIEGLDVKKYNLKSMQDLYFLFIIYICMKYDDTLKCWVLRDYLWGTHVFMAEFYPCIIWKLEKLNLEIAKTFENDDDEDKYKNNIKDELKLLCIIIGLYRGINAQTETHLYNKRLTMINLNIEKLREVIQKHLESFYYVDFATLINYLANKMNNHKICKSDIDEVGKLDKSNVEFLRLSDYIKSHDKLSDARRLKRIEGKKNNLEFYKDLHLNRMAKNALFIIAFTINISSIKSSVYSMPYIKSTTIKKYKKIETEDNRTIVNKNNKKGVIRKEKIIEKKQLKANKEKSRPVKKSKNATEQSKIGVKAANAKKRKKVEYLIDITPSNLFYQYIYNKDLYRDACDDALIGFLYIIKIVGMTEFYENNAQTAKHGDNILRIRLIMQKLYERNKKASSIRNFMFCDMIFKAIKEKVNANNYD